MKFTKMQAYGNDYIYINACQEKLDNLDDIARFICNRHFGVGSDGMVLICPSKIADFRMRIFNPDGSEAEMCGNALRSVGKYVYDYHLTNKEHLKIETLGGVKNLDLVIEDGKVVNIKAKIGSPIFASELIPVKTSKPRFIMEDVEVIDKSFKISCLSWGNPHTVVFVNDLDHLDLTKYGKAIENKKDLFPARTNVTFATIVDRDCIKIREWERGTGETIGCATGCASAVVIANLLGLVNHQCIVKQIGGDLTILYQDQELTMIGPSTIVYDGEIDLGFLKEEK